MEPELRVRSNAPGPRGNARFRTPAMCLNFSLQNADYGGGFRHWVGSTCYSNELPRCGTAGRQPRCWDILARRFRPWTASLHEAIAGKLEAGKMAGWLSDYLVAWHGPRENLAPEVTVWRAADQNDDAVAAI